MAPNTCDCCDRTEYQTSVRSPATYRQYEFEDEFSYLCNECAEEHNILTADSLSDEELIAAIVEDSIGYASPGHAAKHVADYRTGREAIEAEGRRYGVFCERGSACYGQDLDLLVDRAVRCWACRSPERREQLLEGVRRWREIEDTDRVASMGLSMAYPVGGF